MRCMFRKEHRSAFFMYINTNAACRSQAANVFCSTLPDRADHFVLVGFLRGADAATPHPRRPACHGIACKATTDATGSVRFYGGMRGAVEKTIASCLRNVLPRTPSFLPVARGAV